MKLILWQLNLFVKMKDSNCNNYPDLERELNNKNENMIQMSNNLSNNNEKYIIMLSSVGTRNVEVGCTGS